MSSHVFVAPSSSQSAGVISPHAAPSGTYGPEPLAASNRKRGPVSIIPGGDDSTSRLSKRQKVLKTTFTERTSEVKTYMNTQMLDVARKSRDVFTAKIQYQRLRLQELKMIQRALVDELEESQAGLDLTERQIGQIRKQLYSNNGGPGMAKICEDSRERWSCILEKSSRIGSPCGSDLSSRGSHFRNDFPDSGDTVPPTSSASPVSTN